MQRTCFGKSNMKSEFIDLDDPRVTYKGTRPYGIYTLDGPVEKVVHGKVVGRMTMHPNGLHQEPRMTTVLAPVKSWTLEPGNYAELEVEDIAMLGIAVELADHHWDLDLYIDYEKIYGEFYCVSSYLPSNDGYGRIHWVMMDRARHKVRVQASNKYNRMLDVSQVKPTHTCLSGFVLLDDMRLPPPTYGTWVYTQDPLPDAYAKMLGTGSLRDNVIPAQGQLYLMDLYGLGTLETLTFRVDYPIVLELIDGGTAQPEFTIDFPAWLRRVDLGAKESGALATVVSVVKAEEGSRLIVTMTKPVSFASRLIVRLFNPDVADHTISGMYMEGTLRCM